MFSNPELKNLKFIKILLFGSVIWFLGAIILFTTFVLFLSHARFIFNNEEWVGFGLVCFAITNLINFVMYLPFYFKNKKILDEIENDYIDQVSKGRKTIYFLAWNPFSMKWFKYLVVSKSKKFCKDEIVWNNSRRYYWEGYANSQVKMLNLTLLRPIYMIFIFSIQSLFKFLAINKYIDERKEA